MRRELVAASMAAAAIGSVLGAPTVSAQSIFQMTPSLTTALVSDSNLLARASDRQADLISRLSPGLDAEYRSKRLTLFGRYTLDAERFARHAALSTPQARQHAAVDLRYRVQPRMTAGVETSFSTTETPGELNLLSGVMLGRGPARRIAVSPALTYRPNAVTDSTVTYAFTQDRLAGGTPTTSHTATVAGERRMSARSAARADYIFRQFDFGAGEVTRSHTAIIAWTHDVTRRTRLSLAGGPRVGDGAVAPEIAASVSVAGAGAGVSAAYTRSLTTLIGLAGAATADHVSVTTTYGRTSSRRFRVQPAVMTTRRSGAVVRVYRLTVGASSPIGRALSLDIAYDITRQRGDLYDTRMDGDIVRHLTVIGLSLSSPARAAR